MSLWIDFSWEQDDYDDMPWSEPANRMIGVSVYPLHIYNLGEDCYVKFGWNCATFASAVSHAKRYVRTRYEAIDIEVIRIDDHGKREFTLRFTRND